MSRGPGKMQNAILRFLEDRGRPVTLEALRWELYHGWQRYGGPAAKPTLAADSELPAKWVSSITRSTDSLVAAGRVSAEKRKLQDFAECCANFPGKTLDVSIYRIRQELLPALHDWIDSGSGPIERYGQADNEEHFARQHLPKRAGKNHAANKGDEARLRAFANRWDPLEADLRKVFAETGSEAVFRLIARGRFLFRGFQFGPERTLRDLINTCAAKRELAPPMVDALTAFATEFFPASDTRSYQLKSLLHSIATIRNQNGTCVLVPDAVEALYERKKPFMEALPEFVPARKLHSGLEVEPLHGAPTSPRTRGFFDPKPTHDPRIHRLIDRTVLARFTFLSLPPRGSAASSPRDLPAT